MSGQGNPLVETHGGLGSQGGDARHGLRNVHGGVDTVPHIPGKVQFKKGSVGFRWNPQKGGHSLVKGFWAAGVHVLF